MFAELESLRGASTEEAKARRKTLTEQVTIELVRHSVAEEVIVYPKVEEKVSAEEARHAREEHAEAEETLAKLEKLDADGPAFDDIEEEEGEMFATCGRSSTPTSCGSSAPVSKPSRRSPRLGRTRPSRTSRCRASPPARPRRRSTACATLRRVVARTAERERFARPRAAPFDY
jgi:hypothetical protein